uniref:Cilia-and flagella-associated protein 96 n=2 Tax=Eutreptiella gymnastica TaxID=73025 RepID=A0A7S1I7X0_9EUGL|mmetsp:Transcript_137196/g.238582  ORF Transcript_137196/g.238582 Transcript_137196/m.238582 type:complete len:295 (+) Transcript_137196:121-1005(+)
MFSSPSYNTIGDEYDKKIPISDRTKGRQMVTAPTKKGSTPDVCFEKKFASLSLGAAYMEPGSLARQDNMAKAKKKLTPEGFKYTNPPKKSCGAGTYMGTFSEKNPFKHETEYVVVKKGELPEKVAAQPRNIVTGSAKKGTYGMIGTTLSKGSEYTYISDAIDGGKKKSAADAKEASKKFIGPAFKAACKRVDFFDGHANVAASKVYSLDKPLPARKPEAAKKEVAIAIPFKPVASSKGTLNGYPEYKEDPYDVKEKAQREQAKKDKPSVVWKPISTSKSLPTKSIAFNKTLAAE